MSDALPLPPRPNLEQYKNLARDFQRACKRSQPTAIREWAVSWVERLTRLRGIEITTDVRREIDREAQRIERRFEQDEDRQRIAEKIRSDARMLATLGAEAFGD